ncbi:MAG TPA: hypothetical protein VIY72_16820 [Acidimicrobiales bacterium]
MASTLTDLSIAAQDNVLGAIDTSKSYVLESVKAWSATTHKLLPEMPAIPGLSALSDLTGPMEMVSMGYDFTEKLLASQRSFMEEMVEALAPAPA